MGIIVNSPTYVSILQFKPHIIISYALLAAFICKKKSIFFHLIYHHAEVKVGKQQMHMTFLLGYPMEETSMKEDPGTEK
jgi:hypothetical protein